MSFISLLKPGVDSTTFLIFPKVMIHHTASTVHTFMALRCALLVVRGESLLRQEAAEEMRHLGLAARLPAYFLDQAKGLPRKKRSQLSQR